MHIQATMYYNLRSHEMERKVPSIEFRSNILEKTSSPLYLSNNSTHDKQVTTAARLIMVLPLLHQ